jgi:hypothetical protein
MVAQPADTPVIVPVLLTVAIDELLLDHEPTPPVAAAAALRQLLDVVSGMQTCNPGQETCALACPHSSAAAANVISFFISFLELNE